MVLKKGWKVGIWKILKMKKFKEFVVELEFVDEIVEVFVLLVGDVQYLIFKMEDVVLEFEVKLEF